MIVSEHQEQTNLIKWTKWVLKKYPELALLFAIPNGGQRKLGVAKKGYQGFFYGDQKQKRLTKIKTSEPFLIRLIYVIKIFSFVKYK